MAAIDSGVGMPGDASSVLEINNLAKAQSEVNQMLVGYTRSIFINTPSKPQAIYTEGDEIVFDWPSSRDFINFAGSMFMFDLQLTWHNGKTAEDPGEAGLGVSIAHIFDRLEVYNGSTKIETIEEYGKYVFHELKTKTVSGGEYLAHGYFGGIHPEDESATNFHRNMENMKQNSCMFSNLFFPRGTSSSAGTDKTETVKVIYPVKSLFERSGYLPIGNIYKGLQFRFKLASRNNFTWLGSFGNSTYPSMKDTQGKSYIVYNPVWKMDSMKYSLGGMPALGEHVFHTFGTRVNRLAIEATSNARYILDYNWSSLKRCVSFLDFQKNVAIGDKYSGKGAVSPARVPWSQGYWDPSKSYKYWYNAGTLRFPEDDPVEDKRSGYYHYLKTVHMQDVAGDLSDTTGGFSRDFDITTSGTEFGQFHAGVYMSAKFDKLDQSGSVISGTDVSSRYVILNVEEEPSHIGTDTTGFGTGGTFETAVSAERYVICNYDIFIILFGGRIAVQD